MMKEIHRPSQTSGPLSLQNSGDVKSRGVEWQQQQQQQQQQ
jgi:hypothetical protein